MDDADPNELRAILRHHMAANDLTVNSWAKRANMPESTLRNFLAGRSETITYATLVALAKAIERNVVSLFASGTDEIEAIQVLHEVRSDHWSDHMFADHEARFWINLPRDPRYPSVHKEGALVSDDSFDQHYPSGTIVVCADYGDLKRLPHHGDRIVCVEHGWSADALQHEESLPDLERTSVRELVTKGDQNWLVLRSNTPHPYTTLTVTEPISPPADILAPYANIAEGGWVELRGVVIGTYRLE